MSWGRKDVLLFQVLKYHQRRLPPPSFGGMEGSERIIGAVIVRERWARAAAACLPSGWQFHLGFCFLQVMRQKKMLIVNLR